MTGHYQSIGFENVTVSANHALGCLGTTLTYTNQPKFVSLFVVFVKREYLRFLYIENADQAKFCYSDYDWEFNEQGDAITTIVNWSKALYDATNLFQAHLRENKVAVDHPKLHAMQMQTEVLFKKYSTMSYSRGFGKTSP